MSSLHIKAIVSLFLFSALSFTVANASTIQLNFTNGWIAEFDDQITSPGRYGRPDITNPEQALSGGIDYDTRTELSYAAGVNTFVMKEHRYISNGNSNYLMLSAIINGAELSLNEFLNLADVNSTLFLAEYSHRRNYQSDWRYTSEETTLKTVPLPPAVWLFGSALASFGFIRNRKKLA